MHEQEQKYKIYEFIKQSGKLPNWVYSRALTEFFPLFKKILRDKNMHSYNFIPELIGMIFVTVFL